jgi:DNA polymerase I-like protein with 3'-5' exonuclease and polymerase domains
MDSKEFIHKRICIYAGRDIDPNSDEQVEDGLRSKFNIYLPQRKSMNESLASAKSDHEIIGLILKYRAMI